MLLFVIVDYWRLIVWKMLSLISTETLGISTKTLEKSSCWVGKETYFFGTKRQNYKASLKYKLIKKRVAYILRKESKIERVIIKKIVLLTCKILLIGQLSSLTWNSFFYSKIDIPYCNRDKSGSEMSCLHWLSFWKSSYWVKVQLYIILAAFFVPLFLTQKFMTDFQDKSFIHTSGQKIFGLRRSPSYRN